MSDAEEPAPDVTHADIGIVHALSVELAPFLDRCEKVRKYVGGDMVFRGARFGAIRIALVQCGMGAKLAAQGTRALIDAHSPRWIISAGFSGALQPGMKVGDIVTANAIADTHGRQFDLDLKMPADPSRGLHVGKLLVVEEFVRTIAEKKALAEQHGAIAVDLESLAVAEVCRETKNRFLAVRVISDDLSADLPPEILTVVGGTGSIRLGAAVGAIFKRPSSVKDMWRLRGVANTAAGRLATFLEGVAVQLYEADHQPS